MGEKNIEQKKVANPAQRFCSSLSATCVHSKQCQRDNHFDSLCPQLSHQINKTLKRTACEDTHSLM